MEDDGDIVRGLGFVTLYASYLEEQIEDLVDVLNVYKEYNGGWQISNKIKHAIAILNEFDENQFNDLISDLSTSRQLFKDRNKVVHGRIYAGINRPDTLKSSRPNIPDQKVTSSDLYKLANEMNEFRLAIYRPMIIKLPRALNEYFEAKP